MNIFVANMDFNVQEEELKSYFENFGTVSSVKIIKDKETGRSKGYGFVDMPDQEEGINAISNLNGKEIRGRAVHVKISRPQG